MASSDIDVKMMHQGGARPVEKRSSQSPKKGMSLAEHVRNICLIAAAALMIAVGSIGAGAIAGMIEGRQMLNEMQNQAPVVTLVTEAPTKAAVQVDDAQQFVLVGARNAAPGIGLENVNAPPDMAPAAAPVQDADKASNIVRNLSEVNGNENGVVELIIKNANTTNKAQERSIFVTWGNYAKVVNALMGDIIQDGLHSMQTGKPMELKGAENAYIKNVLDADGNFVGVSFSFSNGKHGEALRLEATIDLMEAMDGKALSPNHNFYKGSVDGASPDHSVQPKSLKDYRAAIEAIKPTQNQPSRGESTGSPGL